MLSTPHRMRSSLMADPKWEDIVRRVWPDAVTLLANLVGGRLLDCLFSNQLLTHDQYDELEGPCKRATAEKVARELLQILKKKPCPSFCTFRRIVDTEIEGGSDLCQLLESRDTPPTPTSSSNCKR